MDQTTPNLTLPYIQGGQAQKHVTHNEAIRALDRIVQMGVEGIADDPPPAPAVESRWIVGPAPTGEFAGRAGAVAVREDGAWSFLAPRRGWLAWDASAGALMVHDGAGWAAAGGVPEQVARLGIGTPADGVNRLAVSSEATLLTHAGAGHRLTLNKAAAGETASLLFQTGWSGRAEMGTAGSDGFAIKVSADGASWREALTVDPLSGAVAMPLTPQVQAVQLGARFLCHPDGRWVGPRQEAANYNYSQGLGTGAEPNTDHDGKGLFVPAGTRLDAIRAGVNANSGEVTALDLRVRFQTGPWDASWDSAGETAVTTLYAVDGAVALLGSDMQRVQIDLGGFVAPEDGYLNLCARPVGTVTATRYAYLGGVATIALPVV